MVPILAESVGGEQVGLEVVIVGEPVVREFLGAPAFKTTVARVGSINF